MRHILVLLLALLSMALVGGIVSCGRDGAQPVPRRQAYPRIAMYDSVYREIDDVPVSLLVNAAAAVDVDRRRDGIVWVTARYPAYGATVYYTVTPVTDANVDEVIDNRTERIHLNLGSQRPVIVEGDNRDMYHYNIVYAPSVFTTPLQFIAVKPSGARRVVTGAVTLDNASTVTSVDSVTPIYDALYRDIKLTLDSLADR